MKTLITTEDFSLISRAKYIEELQEEGGLQQEEIDQLKAQVVSLDKNRSYYQEAERELSAAYLRLREILGALDTNSAPTAKAVWKHTEDKAKEATQSLAEHDIKQLQRIIKSIEEHAESTSDYYVVRFLKREIDAIKKKFKG